jgi:hypothetical protein
MFFSLSKTEAKSLSLFKPFLLANPSTGDPSLSVPVSSVTFRRQSKRELFHVPY